LTLCATIDPNVKRCRSLGRIYFVGAGSGSAAGDDAGYSAGAGLGLGRRG